MNYIELINNFWKLDELWQFNGCETRLYFYLLKIANMSSWADAFEQTDLKVSAAVGVSTNTLKSARKRLISSGLIEVETGGKCYGNKSRYKVRYQNLTSKQEPNSYANSQPKLQPNSQPYIKNKTKTETKTEKVKKENLIFENFISEFNEIRKSKFKPLEKIKQQFHCRLKNGYSETEILQALKNAIQDRFHIENNFKYLTPEFILRVDKLEKFLNITQNENRTTSKQNPEFGTVPKSNEEASKNYSERF